MLYIFTYTQRAHTQKFVLKRKTKGKIMINRLLTKVIHPSGLLSPGLNGEKSYVNVGPGSEVWLIAINIPMHDIVYVTGKTYEPEGTPLRMFDMHIEGGEPLNISNGFNLATLTMNPKAVVSGGWIKKIKLSTLGGGIGKNDIIRSPLKLEDLVPLFDASNGNLDILGGLNRALPSAPYGVHFYEEYSWELETQKPHEVERPIFTDLPYEAITKAPCLEKHAYAYLLNNVAALKCIFEKKRKIGFFSRKKAKAEYWVSHEDYDNNGYCYRDGVDTICKGVADLSLLVKQETTKCPPINL